MTQPWYPFFWGDYSAKTHHLTQGQHGAYIMLLRYVYTSGRSIPDEQRYGIARASLEQERIDTDFVLSEFFELNERVWVNKKTVSVMLEAEKKHQARVKAGKKGGKQKSSNATSKLEQRSTNHNHNHIISEANASSLPSRGEPDGFSECWEEFPPQRKGSRQKALGSYRSALDRASAADIILGIRAYGRSDEVARGFAKGMAAWLNDDRWTFTYSTPEKGDDHARPTFYSNQPSKFSVGISGFEKARAERKLREQGSTD